MQGTSLHSFLLLLLVTENRHQFDQISVTFSQSFLARMGQTLRLSIQRLLQKCFVDSDSDIFFFLFSFLHFVVPIGFFPRLIIKCMLGLCVSVIHQTLTWTTGSLQWVVHTWSFLCMRIHTGVGYTDNESAQHFWLWKTLINFSSAPNGVQTSGLWISSPTLYLLCHPIISTLTNLILTKTCMRTPVTIMMGASTAMSVMKM